MINKDPLHYQSVGISNYYYYYSISTSRYHLPLASNSLLYINNRYENTMKSSMTTDATIYFYLVYNLFQEVFSKSQKKPFQEVVIV